MNKSIPIVSEAQAVSEVEAYLLRVDRQMETFARNERRKLKIEQPGFAHWHDENNQVFTASQRKTSTIFFEGMTLAHTEFEEAAYQGIGYNLEPLDLPDTEALQLGREFGNRGQCNPMHFLAGNLLKKLRELETSGLSKQEIIERYLFLTPTSCGPCRFGSYTTEYRKVLRDAGFDGFRVIVLQQPGMTDEESIRQAVAENSGAPINARFFLAMFKAIILGDVLNILMYRIRPYEIYPGHTDKVIARARVRITKALKSGKGLVRALLDIRRDLNAIEVDRSRVKPKVAIIGEFWAMTTEGAGNYHLPAFLEQQGAEVKIQPVIAWGLYLFWGARTEIKQRAKLKGADNTSINGLSGVPVGKNLAQIWLIEKVARGLFGFYARLLGLNGYQLANMDYIARLSHDYYDNELRGGEGHMEVGKLISHIVDKKATMTLSVKPFGCMPSSAISDGVQSKISELYPEAIFLPIETSGDGAVNVYSRIQMQLYKAKQAAEKELQQALEKCSASREEFEAKAAQTGKIKKALYKSPHRGACSAVDLACDIMG